MRFPWTVKEVFFTSHLRRKVFGALPMEDQLSGTILGLRQYRRKEGKNEHERSFLRGSRTLGAL